MTPRPRFTAKGPTTMRNNKRRASRQVLAELEQNFLQLAIGIALALTLVAWVLAVGEQPSLMFTILVAAIASGMISSPMDRIAQAFWRSFWPSSVERLSNSTDALWEPDWPEAIEARRSIRQWRRHRRYVSVVASGLFWALIFGFITFFAGEPRRPMAARPHHRSSSDIAGSGTSNGSHRLHCRCYHCIQTNL